MKTLIPFVGFVMISLLCSRIFPGQPYNPDRFRQVVIFGDSLSGIERTDSSVTNFTDRRGAAEPGVSGEC
jgi:hypothetical protein